MLNEQQMKVLRLIAKGYSYKEIGTAIYRSRKRTESIAYEIRKILGAKTMPHAIAIAYEKELLVIP